MGQRIYINAMKRNDLVFGIGPAELVKPFSSRICLNNYVKDLLSVLF